MRAVLRVFGVRTDPDSHILAVREEIVGALHLGHGYALAHLGRFDEAGGAYARAFDASPRDQDVRDALTRQVVDGGFSLRELRPLDMTLEDIFLSLTSEEVVA